jgi:type VI secretion system secreted protein Hcp
MFLKIDGIDGESDDSVHAGEIDILAWSWGLSQSGTTHMGGGGGAGKVSVQDLSITKYVDKSSPNLFMACCNGKHFATANLVVRKAGEQALEYIKIDMDEVMVVSVSTGGSGGEDRLTENITLNFAKVKFTYTPQDETGAGGAEIPKTWNIAKNIEE